MEFNKIGDESTDNSNFKVSTVYNLITKSDDQLKNDFLSNKENEENRVESGYDINRLSDTRKSLMQRIFSPMLPGSLRASIFAMSSLALGTGCLALPQNFEHMSFVMALIVLIIGSGSAYWSLTIMIEASRKKGLTEYSKLVKESLGKGMALFLDIMILIYIFGILTSYQVIIYKQIGSFVYEVFMPNDYKNNEEFELNFWDKLIYIKYPIMFATCIILIPLCLLKDISKMRLASLFSIASLFYAIFVIIIECPFYFSNFLEKQKKDPEHNVINWFNVIKGFDQHLYFFRGTATVFFAFTCHVGAFPVYKTLKDNNSRRINKVFQRSIILDLIIYIFVGIAGFLTQPVGTPPLIINREKYFTNDIFMIVARLLIAVNLILSTPANYNAFRLSILETVWGTSEVDNYKNLVITIPTLLITCFIGALYNKIISYISILGGFCSVVIAFLFPGLLYLKNNDMPLSHPKNIITIIIIFTLCTIGFTAGIMTILDDVLKIIK
jgi:amino acid permease